LSAVSSLSLGGKANQTSASQQPHHSYGTRPQNHQHHYHWDATNGGSFVSHGSSSGSIIAMGTCVQVRSGKYAGAIGHVRRSGHGFYAVLLADGSGDEVMKRAIELEIYTETPSQKQQLKQHQQGVQQKQHKSAAAVATDFDDEDDEDEEEVSHAKPTKASRVGSWPAAPGKTGFASVAKPQPHLKVKTVSNKQHQVEELPFDDLDGTIFFFMIS
jgi:hypothetical protein